MIDRRKQKILKDFGRNLKRIRQSCGLSLRELAAAAGLEHAQIGRIELGEVNPTVTTIIDIAEALGVDPGELFIKQ